MSFVAPDEHRSPAATDCNRLRTEALQLLTLRMPKIARAPEASLAHQLRTQLLVGNSDDIRSSPRNVAVRQPACRSGAAHLVW